jgi:arsenate reductase
MEKTSKTNVLFLCTSNSARSQMAEGFLRQYAGDRFNVYSAGLEASGINPLTTKVMNEIGVDISDQYSKSTREFMGKKTFRYVITVCNHADEYCPRALWTTPGTDKLHWPFEDPSAFDGSEADKLAKFREIRDQVDQRIKSWLKEFAG